MAKSHHKPTHEQLEVAPKHVLYELRLLRKIVADRADPSLFCDKNKKYLRSALRDSILLHVRNLYDFLTCPPKNKDDIVAGHFLSNPDGTPWMSSSLSFVKKCIGPINKARSHLTYTRIKMGKYPWRERKMLQEIDAAFSEFLAALPPSGRSAWR